MIKKIYLPLIFLVLLFNTNPTLAARTLPWNDQGREGIEVPERDLEEACEKISAQDKEECKKFISDIKNDQRARKRMIGKKPINPESK